MPAPGTGSFLNGSTSGLPIVVAATSTPGTTLHTAVDSTAAFDALFIFASNVTATAATLTVEWGGTTDPGELLVKGYNIPANSAAVPIAVGQRVNNAVVIKAFSGTASAINVTGWYNRHYL